MGEVAGEDRAELLLARIAIATPQRPAAAVDRREGGAWGAVSSGFFSSAQRAPLNLSAKSGSGRQRSCCQTSRRTLLSSSLPSFTTWNGSKQMVASGACHPALTHFAVGGTHLHGHCPNLSATDRSELVEENVEGLGVAALGAPHGGRL